MIKIAKLLGLCTLLVVLLALPTFAQQISYESAAVGRIVGNTPEEMRGQLVADDIRLEYASYYGDNGVVSTADKSRAEDVVSVVQQKFPNSNDAHFVESLTLGRWNWNDVKDSVGSWTKRSLLLLEAHGDVKDGVVTADSPAYFDESIPIGSFDWNFKDKPLVVFDSDYAGVNVPKRDSFVSSVAGDAVVIAPTAVPDKNFVKVFACNLGKYRTLGETYTNARNNYYWQSNKPSGIALMSYELYGNPASLVSVPDYDEAAISEYCGNFLKNYSEAPLSPVLAVSSLSALGASSWLVNYTGANNPYDRPEPVDVSWTVSDGLLNVSANQWGVETLWAVVGDAVNVPANADGVVFEISLAGRDFSPSAGAASIGFVADVAEAKASGDAQCIDGGLVRSGSSCSLKADSITCTRGFSSGTSSLDLGSCMDASCSNNPYGNLLQEVGGVNDHAGDFATLRLQLNTTHARCSWGENEKVTDWKAHGVSLGNVIPVISFLSGGVRDFDSFGINRISVNGADFDLGNDFALPLRESRRFSIADYSVADSGDFSVLVAGGTMLSSDDGDLVLPVASLVQPFPLKTVVTGVDNVKFSNPVDFAIPNLPSWAGGFVERECSYESRNASLETRHAMDGNRLELFTTIRPVEVVNCSEGMLRLYTEIGFDVNYFSYSPVLMREVTVLDSAAPGEELSAGVTLANIRGGSFSGELTLSEGSRIIAEKAVEFASENELVTALPFKAGSNEGTSQYVLAFVQNGEEKAFYGFSLRVRSIDVSLHAPVTAGESGSVRLIVYNHLPVPVESTIGSFLAKGTGILSESTETTLQPGVNEIPLPYYGLNREDERYDFLVAVPYGEGKATASTVLVTNHPPLLKQISPLTVVEGETVKLSPEAADVDGDEVLITYSGELSEGEWQTERGDAGSYEVSVTASDGLLSASQQVRITVLADEDYDDDGYDSEVDCNDEDALINPGAAEICDALDNNCDGNVDEDACSSQASPDLKVEEITFTPPAPVAGEAVTFTAVIKNVGDASAADIAVASSVNCSGYGWSGGTAPIQVALAPGEVYSYAFSHVFNAEDACTVTMRVSAGGDSNPDNDQGSISLGIGLPITCTDSDGGQEYGIKGAATSSSRDIEGRIDCCKLQHSTFAGDSVAHIGPGGGPCTAEAPYLYEAVCGEDKMPTMVVYRCPNGCNNGACVENNAACQKLLEKVKASYLKACGEAGYDPVADVNKDSRVNALDVSLLSANSNNPVWCSNAHSSTNMPCSAGGGWPPAAKSCPGLESGQQSYFDICKSNGYDNVCFNKYSGEYQGCTRSSNNDCTIGNANAAQNILCNVS